MRKKVVEDEHHRLRLVSGGSQDTHMPSQSLKRSSHRLRHSYGMTRCKSSTMSRLNCSSAAVACRRVYSLPLNFCARATFSFNQVIHSGAVPRCERCLDFSLIWRFAVQHRRARLVVCPTSLRCSLANFVFDAVLQDSSFVLVVVSSSSSSPVPALWTCIHLVYHGVRLRSVCFFVFVVVPTRMCADSDSNATTFIHQLLQNRPLIGCKLMVRMVAGPTCPVRLSTCFAQELFWADEVHGCFDALLRR